MLAPDNVRVEAKLSLQSKASRKAVQFCQHLSAIVLYVSGSLAGE